DFLRDPKRVALLRGPKRTALLWILFGVVVSAQQPQGGGAVRSARDRAPIDLTGYWVSYVTENWRYRMVTPAKGEYRRIPSSRAALPIINAWDPAADERAGNQCKSYGAGNIMSVPGRLHITWQDADTLKIETDAGMQTRLFHFAPGTASSARTSRRRRTARNGIRHHAHPPGSAPRTAGASACRARGRPGVRAIRFRRLMGADRNRGRPERFRSGRLSRPRAHRRGAHASA